VSAACDVADEDDEDDDDVFADVVDPELEGKVVDVLVVEVVSVVVDAVVELAADGVLTTDGVDVLCNAASIGELGFDV
jgi:hypothetical protein